MRLNIVADSVSACVADAAVAVAVAVDVAVAVAVAASILTASIAGGQCAFQFESNAADIVSPAACKLLA